MKLKADMVSVNGEDAELHNVLLANNSTADRLFERLPKAVVKKKTNTRTKPNEK